MYPTIGSPNIFMSVSEQRGNQNILVYPNPARSGSVVRFNTPLAEQARLYDAFGKIICLIPQNTEEIREGNLSPGLYVMVLCQQRIKLIVQ